MGERRRKSTSPAKLPKARSASHSGLSGSGQGDVPCKPEMALTGQHSGSERVSLADLVERRKAQHEKPKQKRDISNSDMLELWQARVFDTTGQKPFPLTPKQRGQMSRIVAELPKNGRTASLAEVMDWAVSRWGEALCLATPWLEKPQNRDKRVELLGKQPELSYFLYWIGCFFDAYEALYYGEGFSQFQLDSAERWQRQFKRAARGELSAAAALDYARSATVRRRNARATFFDGEVSKGRSRRAIEQEIKEQRARSTYEENMRKAGFDPAVKHRKPTDEELADEHYTRMLDDRDGA